MLAIASARSFPKANDDGSSSLRADGDVAACACGAGEGVAGTLLVDVDDATGAAGAAGVRIVLEAGAGVDGARAAADDEAAGWGLG
jgi:hypothetical protein